MNTILFPDMIRTFPYHKQRTQAWMTMQVLSYKKVLVTTYYLLFCFILIKMKTWPPKSNEENLAKKRGFNLWSFFHDSVEYIVDDDMVFQEKL